MHTHTNKHPHTNPTHSLARTAPAPWAELEGDYIILSVPSKTIRHLDNPTDVVSYWDRVMVSHCDLAGCPLPKRKERVVVDQQISAGYMHSGE